MQLMVTRAGVWEGVATTHEHYVGSLRTLETSGSVQTIRRTAFVPHNPTLPSPPRL